MNARLRLPGGELTLVGPMGLVAVRQMPLIRIDRWLDDAPVLMGRNGRPRTRVTLPGHNAGVAPRSKGRKYPPEPLTNDEALALLNAIPLEFSAGGTKPAGLRDRALLALLWRGKGNKTRTVGIDVGALGELQPWLMERAFLGIDNRSPLFCTVQLPGRGNRMASAYVRRLMHEAGERAGIPKRVHPHGLRHSLACSLIREGVALAHVSAQLGHADMATTCIYLRGLGADEAFEAVADRRWPS